MLTEHFACFFFSLLKFLLCGPAFNIVCAEREFWRRLECYTICNEMLFLSAFFVAPSRHYLSLPVRSVAFCRKCLKFVREFSIFLHVRILQKKMFDRFCYLFCYNWFFRFSLLKLPEFQIQCDTINNWWKKDVPASKCWGKKWNSDGVWCRSTLCDSTIQTKPFERNSNYIPSNFATVEVSPRNGNCIVLLILYAFIQFKW